MTKSNYNPNTYPNLELWPNILHYCSSCRLLLLLLWWTDILVSHTKGHDKVSAFAGLGTMMRWCICSFFCCCPCDVGESMLCERFSDDLEQKQRETENYWPEHSAAEVSQQSVLRQNVCQTSSHNKIHTYTPLHLTLTFIHLILFSHTHNNSLSAACSDFL